MNEFEQKIIRRAAVVAAVLLVIIAIVNIADTGDDKLEITPSAPNAISTPEAMRTCTNSEAMIALREPAQKADRGEWTQSQAWAAATAHARRMGCKLP